MPRVSAGGAAGAARAAAWVLGAVAVGGAEAHAPGAPPAATGAFPWSFEPWVLALLALSLAGYLGGVARLWRHAGRGRGIGGWRVAAWCAGWVLLVAALVSPLDPLGERLFSAHMVQHELLMVAAAPLLVAARPLAAWAWALPPAWRAAVGGTFRRPGWRTFWSALTHPLSTWSLHALALWGWHLPAAFDAALAHAGWHVLQHATFLGTALLFWWTVLAPAARPGPGLLALFTTMAHTGALGALMTLSPLVWYPGYIGPTTALGLDPLQDQQLGGLVMWVPAGSAYLVVALALAARTLRPTRSPRPRWS